MRTPIPNSEIVVTFMHPYNGQIIEASMDEMCTAETAIAALISEHFLAPVLPGLPEYYLKVVGGQAMESKDTFQDGCTVLILKRSVG